MSILTRERLRERAREKVKSLEFAVTQTAFADPRAELKEELELARIALASLEATPVGYIDAEYAELIKSGDIESCSVYAETGEGCFPLYSVLQPLTDAELYEYRKGCTIAERSD